MQSKANMQLRNEIVNTTSFVVQEPLELSFRPDDFQVSMQTYYVLV